ncbi:MAG TPA: hypothetical protein VNC11_04810 [Gemmatimonadaceae bacterium]|jgi:hypothetical protein|nr:hypothetical protein [Gemmatimonadaceae bacterium]
MAKIFSLICLLFLAAPRSSRGQAVIFQDSAGHRLNSWTARANNGHSFMGTWTAVPDSADGSVKGTWTLVDGQGRTLGAGTWTAAKSVDGWTGSWRARAEQRAGEYGGTWSTKIKLDPRAQINEMFELALKSAVGGSWWFGNYTGSWAIHAYR